MECRVEAQQYYISVSFGDVIRIFGKRHIKSGTLEDSADHHRAVCIKVRGDDHNLHGCSHLDVVMIYTLLRGSGGIRSQDPCIQRYHGSLGYGGYVVVFWYHGVRNVGV